MPHRVILPLSLVLACGPGSSVTDSGTTTATTGTTSDTSTSAATSDTGASDTGASDTGTTQTPTTTAATTGVQTTGEPTSTSTGEPLTTSGGDSGTIGEDMVEYAAFFGAGGLDHLLIHRADFLNDRCTSIHFASPIDPSQGFMITAPNGWNVSNASVVMGTDGCLAGMPTGDPVSAIGGAGAGTWQQDMDQYCPLDLDLDLTLDFPQDLPWVPAQEQMLVTAVPVQSCP